MIEIKQTATYLAWERKLKDQLAKAAIAARVFRLVMSALVVEIALQPIAGT